MKILVCGGRDYKDKKKVFKILDYIVNGSQSNILINGGAFGADSFAWEWAMDNQAKTCVVTVKANWDKYGKMAGPIRNQQMIDNHHPDLVLAFPGGAGTRDCIDKALKCGIVVLQVAD